MFLFDLLAALVVAVLFTVIFSLLFRNSGPWAIGWIFLLVIFLATWAGGVWIEPFGPPIFGVYWMPFLFFGLLITFILAAATPRRTPRTRTEAIEQARAEEEMAEVFNVFFWIMIIGLVVAIIFAYI